MSGRHEHLQRARENEALAKSLILDRGIEVDWCVVMLFYAAVHYIEAFLAGKNLRSLSHKDRDDEIQRNGSLDPIYGDYRRLKDMSREAGYSVPNYDKLQLPPIQVRYARVKNHIEKLLGV